MVSAYADTTCASTYADAGFVRPEKSARQIRVVTPVCVMVTNVTDEAFDQPNCSTGGEDGAIERGRVGAVAPHPTPRRRWASAPQQALRQQRSGPVANVCREPGAKFSPDSC